MAAALCPSALSRDGGQGQQLESAQEARAELLLSEEFFQPTTWSQITSKKPLKKRPGSNSALSEQFPQRVSSCLAPGSPSGAVK